MPLSHIVLLLPGLTNGVSVPLINSVTDYDKGHRVIQWEGLKRELVISVMFSGYF